MSTHDNNKQFGDLFRFLRKQAGLTLRELGQRVAYSETHLARLEAGKRQPDPVVIQARFIAALDLKPDAPQSQQLLRLARAPTVSPKDDRFTSKSEAAAVQSTRTNPYYLSHPTTSFVGRRHDIDELSARIVAIDGPRLITLTGAGGVGKTRLAIELAHQIQQVNRWGDGICFVELAGVIDSALVDQTIARALRLPLQADLPVLDSILTFLRDKQFLLIIDNCEHLITMCATLIHRMLEQCQRLHVLATSREALHIPGEQKWRVPSLSLAQDHNQPGASEACTLFIDRAQLADPLFDLQATDINLIEQICHKLDGIPLAIEMAAVQVRVYRLIEIAEQLDKHLWRLSNTNRVAPPRHQTLHAALDWSYSLLSPDEQMLFTAMSVFVEGWPLAAADYMLKRGVVEQSKPEHVVGESLARNLLVALLDKSLIVTRNVYGHPSRYGMLEVVRQFAQAKLIESGYEVATRNANLAYWVIFAEEQDDAMIDANIRDWQRRIGAEQGNIYAALEWSRVNSGQVESAILGLRLAIAMARFWARNRLDRDELRWLLEVAFWQPEASTDLDHSLEHLRAIALFYSWTPIYRCCAWEWRDKLRHQINECLTHCREASDQLGIAYCQLALGNLAFNADDSDQAQQLARLSLQIFDTANHPRGIVHSMGLLLDVSIIKFSMPDFDTLLETYIGRLDLLGAFGYQLTLKEWLAERLMVQGDAARASHLSEVVLKGKLAQGDLRDAWFVHDLMRRTDLARARQFAERFLEEQRLHGDAETIATALHQLEYTLLDCGEFAIARIVVDEAIAIMRTLDVIQVEHVDLAHALCHQGIIARWQGEFAQSLASFEESERLFIERSHGQMLGGIYLHRGYALLRKGDLDAACKDLRDALIRFREMTLVHLYTIMLGAFAELMHDRGDAQTAMILAGAAHAHENMMSLIQPHVRFDYDQFMNYAHAAIVEPTLSAAWIQGQQMTLDEATSYALIVSSS